MKNYLQVLLAITLTTLFSCSSDDDDNQPQTIDMRINHYQGTGLAVGPVLTYLVQKGEDIGTDNWGNFYSDIEGFNYEPGYIYNLSVATERIDNPPADGSSIKYTLQEIISKEKVDNETLFSIYLKLNGKSFLTINSSSNYKILSQIEVDCNELCEALNENNENRNNVIGIFRRLQNNEIQLVGFEQ